MREIIKQVVYPYTKDLEAGHDFCHLERVDAIAQQLKKGLIVDDNYLLLLIYLHDIEDHKLKLNVKVKDLLDELKIDEITKAKVLSEIFDLSFSKYKTKDNLSIEAQIVSDADRIDAMGAIGVARAFSYGAINNRKFYGNDSTIKHFEEKLLVLDQYLYLDEARRIAKPRMEFLKQFYQEFMSEIQTEC